VGLVNTLDYYQTQVNLNKAAFDVIQAKYDLLFKTKVIDFYLGKPINF
jgi:outer membrane protein